MAIKHNLIILIFLNIFSFILSENKEVDMWAPKNGTDYPGIECGKKNPEKPKDCIKFGTDSGMLCCWVSRSNVSSDGQCTLLSSLKADQMKINGTKLFTHPDGDNHLYWDCGNKSIFLNISIILNFVLIFMAFL